MTKQLKNALCYIRVTSTLQAEIKQSITYQNDVITAFGLANGFDIIDCHNDFRSDADTDYKWLDEYFGNAHKTIQYLLIFSIERLGRDVQTSIEAAKYLNEKYSVKVMSARQPELDFATINPDDISKLP
ncbi:MAG: recombinase family protein [Chitinophagaceae bacterium]